jgi:hypothetical protein
MFKCSKFVFCFLLIDYIFALDAFVLNSLHVLLVDFNKSSCPYVARMVHASYLR